MARAKMRVGAARSACTVLGRTAADLRGCVEQACTATRTCHITSPMKRPTTIQAYAVSAGRQLGGSKFKCEDFTPSCDCELAHVQDSSPLQRVQLPRLSPRPLPLLQDLWSARSSQIRRTVGWRCVGKGAQWNSVPTPPNTTSAQQQGKKSKEKSKGVLIQYINHFSPFLTEWSILECPLVTPASTPPAEPASYTCSLQAVPTTPAPNPPPRNA